MTGRLPRLVYTATAVADLTRLRAFIAEHDPGVARRIGAQLLKRIEALRRFPLLGKAVAAAPDPETIRDMVFGKYIVRYAVQAQSIVVLRVWHHFEDH